MANQARQVVLTTQSGESYVNIDDTQLIFDPATDYKFSMRRSVTHGDVFSDADGQKRALFGPNKNDIFTVHGTDVQRQDDSVLIEIYRRNQDDFSDVYVWYYARDLGVVSPTRYEYCPFNVALAIDVNYQDVCEDTFPGQVLVNPYLILQQAERGDPRQLTAGTSADLLEPPEQRNMQLYSSPLGVPD